MHRCRRAPLDVPLLAVEDFDHVPTPVEEIEAGDRLEVDTGHGLQQIRVETVELIYEEDKPATVRIKSEVIESSGGRITMSWQCGAGLLVTKLVPKQ